MPRKSAAIEQLKEFITVFNAQGQLFMTRQTPEYKAVMRRFIGGADGIRGYSDKAIIQGRRESYKMASDDQIAAFFFRQCPKEFIRRRDMLSACVINNDIERANYLIDLLIANQEYPDYDTANGWGRWNELSIKYLVHLYDYHHSELESGIIIETLDITDEMRRTVSQLVDRIKPYLPDTALKELSNDLYMLGETDAEFDAYMQDLMHTVDYYTTFPRPKMPRSKRVNINALSEQILDSFRHLSIKGRADLIAQIMLRFAEVKDILEPVRYPTWICHMTDTVSNDILHQLFQEYPEIFIAFIESDASDSDIRSVAQTIHWECPESDYTAFQELVLAHGGSLEAEPPRRSDAFSLTMSIRD